MAWKFRVLESRLGTGIGRRAMSDVLDPPSLQPPSKDGFVTVKWEMIGYPTLLKYYAARVRSCVP